MREPAAGRESRFLTGENAETAYRSAFLAAAAVKVLLAAVFPFTGDEAYFLVWAKFPDFGYYDHPPMIGWILRALLAIGDSRLILRLPAILSTLFVGAGIFHLLKEKDRTRAFLVSILFLVAPIDLLFVLVTTDTPMMIFTFLSAAFFFRAVERGGKARFLASGAFLGLAFLSKYFAVLLGAAYLACVLFGPRKRGLASGLALLLLAALPFVLVNVYWNYTHCWANLLFNLINRNRGEGFSPVKPLSYAAMLAYLFTPPFVYFLAKKRKELAGSFAGNGAGPRIFAFLFCVPAAALFLLSFRKSIGLHWILAFVPFAYLWMFHLLDEAELRKSIRFMAVLSLVHLLLAGAALSVPLKYIKGHKHYGTIVLGMKPDAVKKALSPYDNAFVFSTESYSVASMMEYHLGRHFVVFGEGSHHARQDDLVTDFRALQGRNFLILRRSEPAMENYLPYFERVDVERFGIEGATFPVVLGYGFSYDRYKRDVLERIRERYYSIPSCLPVGSCYFTDRYFPPLPPAPGGG